MVAVQHHLNEALAGKLPNVDLDLLRAAVKRKNALRRSGSSDIDNGKSKVSPSSRSKRKLLVRIPLLKLISVFN